MELRTELPEEIVGWVGDAARRFEVTRSELIQRAVEHYLGHMDEVKAEFEQRKIDRESGVDWSTAKETLRKAHCRYDHCPYAEDCPADVCPL